ncbi:SDR family NAD(P)-dependent oxidoreductase [Streptomyces boncukensis]|uniref:Glucose 1-dehydrogenase n=1 Tax=Streptomyces boncukensis TaxID=2711219 RepID=A0A6G4X619_9ACTN|nr:glucose 1-dehydrogenase [Streptomyces boncukensis]NGO72965.1 glucose 1-dehydrogenase [Streptomyces boncukensis]
MTDPHLPALTGQVALVTGASGVIGAGIAEQFARAGAAVVAHYHRGEKQARALVERLAGEGAEATAVQADLTDERQCHTLVEEAAAWRGGRLDALVNNAGVQPVQPLAELTAEDWRWLYDSNVTSAFVCTQAAATVMGAQEGGGAVTHIASIEGSQPAFGHAHYNASKAALIMHARAAALELGPRRVRVNSVSPGLIDQPGLAANWPEGVERWTRSAPLTRLGRPEDIGNACVFLASPAASWITGTDLTVDGGVSAHPTW